VKFKMAQNSLFAILLRSPWWVSLAIGATLALLSLALLPPQYRIVGALSGLPFVVIAGIALQRQWRLPSAARIAQTRDAVATMAWPAFAVLLEQAFQRDGYTVVRAAGEACDFELARDGRRTLVSARRWKSARIGLEALRALQDARRARDVSDAVFIGLGPLSDNAVPYAAEHGIAVWQAAELAHALRGLPLAPARPR